MDSTTVLINLRDKIALAGLILFGVLAFITIWIALGKEKIDGVLVTAMVGMASSVVTALAAVYRGNPSIPLGSKEKPNVPENTSCETS